MRRVVLASLVCSACRYDASDPCFPLADVPIRNLGEATDFEDVEEDLRSQLDEFAEWVGPGRLCLREVSYEDAIHNEYFGMDVDGEYRSGERRVRLVAGAVMPELVRHELCHALDDQNHIVEDAPVRWGSESVEGDTPGERYDSLPSEVFARACAAHPAAVLYHARLEREGCIPRDERLASLAEEVWIGAPPMPEYAGMPWAKRYELHDLPTERFTGVDGWLVGARRPSPSRLEVAFVDVASGRRVATQVLTIDETARDFGLFSGERSALVVVGPPGREHLALVGPRDVVEVRAWTAGLPLLGQERGGQFWYSDGTGPHMFDLSTHATTDVPLPASLLEVSWAGFQAGGDALVGLGWTDSAHSVPVAFDVRAGTWSHFAAFPNGLSPAKGVVAMNGLLTAVWGGGLARATTDAVVFDDAGCASPAIGREDGTWVAVLDGWGFVSAASASGEREVEMVVFE